MATGGGRFEERLKSETPILVDGGLATQIEAQGNDISTALWSAELLKSAPAEIVRAHRAYLEAGAECIITASYQATRSGLMVTGLSAEQSDQLIGSAVALAKQARDAFLSEGSEGGVDPLIAASIGPYGAFLHDGSEYSGKYPIGEQGLLEFHKDRLTLLDDCGADVIACETIPNIDEARALATLLTHVVTPAWVSFSCRDAKHISDGTRISDAAQLFANHPRVLAVGVNCTAPQHVAGLIGEIRAALLHKAIVVYPNSGERYHSSDNTWHGTSSPLKCGDAAIEWYDAGATLIGGCCRMGPDHIRAMYEKLRTIK